MYCTFFGLMTKINNITIIIEICFNFLIFRRRFDFQSPSRMDRNVELFLNIEKALKEVSFVVTCILAGNSFIIRCHVTLK